MKHERSFMVFSFITGLLMLSAMLVPVSLSQNPVVEINGTPTGWSDDILLSNPGEQDQYCSIKANGDEIYVVWTHTNYAPLEYFIYYTKSDDGGRTWELATNISDKSDYGVFYADIDVSGQYMHTVWDDDTGWDGIYYRNSTDGGETWNSIKRISSNGVDAAAPHIFVNNSNLHIIWNDWRDGANGEAYYRRSLDGGITFDDGQGVDQDRRISNSPSVVTAPRIAGFESNISVTWMDERNGDFEIYWMISEDNGFTWEDGLGNVGLDRRLSFTGVLDYSISVNGSNIHILWSNEQWPGPVYRLYYRNSTDNGVTWNTPQLLTGPNPGVNSPDLDVVGDNISVVWDDRRDDGDHNEIYLKNSTDGGITWSSDLRLTYNLSRWGLWPRISVDNGKKHVVWFDKITNTNHDIMYKRYPDFPDTTPPDHFNETPPPDSYRDAPGTNVSVHVTDLSGVNESTIQLWVNGSLVPHSTTPIADGFNVSHESPGFDPGVIECRIVADDNLGNHLDYTWNFTVLALYEIQLHEGWNLISVPHVQVDRAINEVLKDIDGKWNYIQWYDSSDPSDHWKTNATFKPDQLNDLKSLNHKMGFWINITEPNVNLTVRGHLSTYTEIQLYAGWNLVGYSTQNTETIANALWGTGADKVEVFDPGEPYRIREVGPTYVMKPGEGYWVHVVADSTWTVNW